jgi:hypothetical protein
VCAFSLNYTACKARAPYCIVRGVSVSTTFFLLSHKRHDFPEKRVIEHEICVVIFIRRLSEWFSFEEELSKILQI